MALRVLVLSFIFCLLAQTGLCSTTIEPSTEAILRAKRVALNYLALDDRVFRLNQNVSILDQEFLCALDILSKTNIDLELQSRLASFAPKPWNKADWLNQAYEKISQLLEPAFLDRLRISFLKIVGSSKTRLETLLSAGKEHDLSDEEVEFIAKSFSDFPFFVTFDEIKNYSSHSDSSFKNAFRIVKKLRSLGYFFNDHRYYQLFSQISGNCDEINPGLEYLLACKNFSSTARISINPDLLPVIFSAEGAKLSESSLRRLSTGSSSTDMLIQGLLPPTALFDLMRQRLWPGTLLSRQNFEKGRLAEIVKNRFPKLKTEEKIRVILNLSKIDNITLPFESLFLRETDEHICFAGATLFPAFLLPLQGKLQKACSDILIWSRFCNVAPVIKKKSLPALALLANEQCFPTISGSTLTNQEILGDLFYRRDFLIRVVSGEFKLPTFSMPFFIQHDLPSRIPNLDLLNFLDEDHQERVYLKLDLDLSKLKSRKRFLQFFENLQQQDELNFSLLGKTFSAKTLFEEFQKRVFEATSPDATLEVCKQYSTIFCNSAEKHIIVSKILTLEPKIQNFRTLVQVKALRFILTKEDELLKQLVLTPFRLDIEEIFKSGC